MRPTDNSTMGRYIVFCLDNQLFLNAWVGDRNAMPASSDGIAFSPITVPLGNDQMVPELLRILNEIKEAYVTSRYMLYVSQSRGKVLDNISKLTTYFDLDLGDLHGIYIGLCKSAYMRCFDVLDKVARIVNVYFGIGRRTDYFWHVFAERQSRGEEHEIRFVARPAIVATGNYSLYALSDLCIDYFESEHVDLKTIDLRRNRMTHDYLAVTIKIHAKNPILENEIPLDELYRQTLAVLQLSKYAILYVVSAIHIAESQKATNRTLSAKAYHQTPGHTARAIKRRSPKKSMKRQRS